jgi:hypothetical protein
MREHSEAKVNRDPYAAHRLLFGDPLPYEHHLHAQVGKGEEQNKDITCGSKAERGTLYR